MKNLVHRPPRLPPLYIDRRDKAAHFLSPSPSPMSLSSAMALPHHHHHHLQEQHFQPQPLQQQQQSKNNLRNLYTIDGQIPMAAYYNSAANLPDQSSHPPYIPPFHVEGFAPGPGSGVGPVTDGSETGLGLAWNYGLEPQQPQAKRKRLKEQDFLDNTNNNNNHNNNSQISSLDILQPQSVSTGLGLSLDNNARILSSSGSGDSALLSLIGDEIDSELQRQDAEIDRYLKVQGDRLRQTILEKVQANQLQTISLVEEKVLQKLREKEAELESINKKNMELEEQMDYLSVEAGAWQLRARQNENMVNALKINLQQVYARSRDSKEGCGDSEVDDTASCCNGRAIDFHLLCKDKNDMKELMTCKVCRVKEVCMLLLPCKHLCLCKDCEVKLNFCPLCHSSKFIGIEVYM